MCASAAQHTAKPPRCQQHWVRLYDGIISEEHGPHDMREQAERAIWESREQPLDETGNPFFN
jgi:hypothetical protein